MNENQIENREDAAAYVQGGNATFTVVSKSTGTRFTYRARMSHNGTILFLDTLTGPDNDNDFSFVGTLAPAPRLSWKYSAKSPLPLRAPSVQALAWFIMRGLHNDQAFEKVEFYHSGKCSRCHRTLTDPESLRTGLGPICREKR